MGSGLRRDKQIVISQLISHSKKNSHTIKKSEQVKKKKDIY